MPNWIEIKREWETTKITLAALAEKHNIKLGTLKSRKSREKWSRGATKKDAINTKKVATIKNKDAPLKKSVKAIKEPVIENEDLTDKQRLFCIYYIKYFNATKAYQKAYECAYSTAMSNGHSLLRKTEIAAEIDRLKAEQASELKLDVRDVLQKYIDIAFADITDFVEFGQEKKPELDHNLEPMIDENGDEITYSYSYVNLRNHNEVDGTIITEVKKGKEGVSVKLADKMKALEMLSKYFDLLSENDKKRLQEEKLRTETEKAKAEITKLKGEDGTEYEDDGFMEAIKSSTDIWDDEDE